MRCRSLVPLLAMLSPYVMGQTPFEGFVNKGLVGVGRLPAATFDRAGDGRQDTLGGFSAMAVDAGTLQYAADGTIRGRLVGLPDRGFGDGATDYRPRMEVFEFSITPYYGDGTVGQDQIVFSNVETILFRHGAGEGELFTGFDAGNTNAPTVPRSQAGSAGGGRLSLDAEGLVLAPDGGYWVSDEYGPGIFRFDSGARLSETWLRPAALVPVQGAYPGRTNFTGAAAPTSGRRNNRGLEGLSLTPDGKRLAAFLQSPTIQDGGAGNLGRNTRMLQLDVEPGSAGFGRVLTEHVYQLTLNGNATTNRHTPVSEVLALNPTTFLVLERDGIGRGADPGLSPTYKKIVLASTEGASNIAGSGYDLESGAPGQLSLPATGASLPGGLVPMRRLDFVDLLDKAQLERFGLNTSTNQDVNSLCEKWEALSLIPLKDPAFPDDYLLLVGNDNDFKAERVFHNGVVVGTNVVTVDLMLLAYRVTLPGIGTARPANVPPTVTISQPSGGEYARGLLPLTAAVEDPDGVVVSAAFFDGSELLGTKTAYPWVWEIRDPAVGEHRYRVVVTDDRGAVAEAVRTVQVTAGNLAPAVALVSPVDGTAVSAPHTLALAVETMDTDGVVASVDYYAGSVRLATSKAAPFGVSVPAVPVGVHVLTAVATDNLGLARTSAPVRLTVSRAVGAPMVVQLLHASDFEAGIEALDDAPRFSSVLSALRRSGPANTLVLSSGDNYIPGPFFTASADPALPYNGVKGRADIEILNALGIQAACFGNHEFDDNTPQVRSLILRDAAVGYAGTRFPYLSANLNFATDSSLSSLVGSDAQEASGMTNRIAKSAVVTVDGQRIGLVGVTTAELRAISSPGGVGVSQNLAGEVQPAVDALLARGVNKVILLAHLQQFALELDLARQLREVDVVIAGGSHAVFANPGARLRSGDVAASPYPTRLSSASGEPVYVVNAGSNYRYVGRLIASFDGAGVLTGFDSRSGPYPTDVLGVEETGGMAPDTNVVRIVTGLASVLDRKDGNRFGRTTAYLNGIRGSVRTEETNLGDLTADANLWRARKTDPTTVISLKNGGGIRDAIGAVSSEGGGVRLVPPPANPRVRKQAGEVSQLDIENSLRFNNALSLITLTAAQLRDAMEWSVAGSGTPGQFPQVSGLAFSFQPTNRPMTYLRDATGVPASIDFPGERLRNLVVVRGDGSQDLVVENGVLVGNPARTFRMVTLNFLAGGGDSYLALTRGVDRVDLVPAGTPMIFDTDGGEQRALAEYLAEIGVYSETDLPASEDARIQNLSRRPDAVLAPVVLGLEGPSPGTRLVFRTLPGRRYVAESRETVDGPWQRLPGGVAGSGLPAELIDARPPAGQRYYRVLAE